MATVLLNDSQYWEYLLERYDVLSKQQLVFLIFCLEDGELSTTRLEKLPKIPNIVSQLTLSVHEIIGIAGAILALVGIYAMY